MAYAQKKNEGKSKYEIFMEGLHSFGKFLYNKEKGEVMGRNGSSWAKITVFFVIFYSCLAAFFAAMLAVFLTTVPEKSEGPKLTQYIANKPGIKAVPVEIYDFKYGGNAGGYNGYVGQIEKFLKPYKAQTGTDQDKYDNSFCSFEDRTPRPKDQKKQCRFDLDKLGPCWKNESSFKFGYDKGQPCIFLRMNRVFNWVPQPYSNLSHVEVKCNRGKVHPAGYPVSFYPYRIEDNWLAPIVAVQLNKTGDFILKCDLEAKNIEKSDSYRMDRGAYGRLQIKVGSIQEE